MSNRNNKYYQTLFLILVFLIAYSLQLNATIRYVSKTGNSTPPYLTWETAADSIQKCINICVFGDTIYVANGVYEEQVVMIDGLSLIGAGMDSCVINLTSTGLPAVEIKDNCLLEGFKILVPNTLNSWGIKADTSGVGSKVTLNKVVNSSLGIYVRFSNPLVYKNIFENIKTRGIWIFNSNSVIRQNHTLIDLNSQAATLTGMVIESFNNDYTPIIDSNYVETKNRGIEKSFGARPRIKNNVITFMQDGEWAIFLSTSDTAYIYTI